MVCNLRRSLRMGVMLVIVTLCQTQLFPATMQAETQEQRNERMAWWRDARFGMFIHWGVYALPAGTMGAQSRADHQRGLPEVLRALQSRSLQSHDWARMAKEGGMKYVVLTAKHHEGFCLFDSQFTDYKSTNTPCHKDLVRVRRAFRTEGLKVGFYYSLIDWHHPDYTIDRIHPLRFRSTKRISPRRTSQLNRPRYGQVSSVHKEQVRELLTTTARSASSGSTILFPASSAKAATLGFWGC